MFSAGYLTFSNRNKFKKEVIMTEKRNFVRLKKALEITYKVIIDKFANTAVRPSLTSTATISGNGLSFMSPKRIEKGTRLEMEIEIPGKPVELAAEVIKIKSTGPGEYEIVVKYTEIDEPERDRLVKYILREGVKAKGGRQK